MDPSEILAQANAMVRAGLRSLAVGLKQGLEEIMIESKAEYVPVDTGTLRDSGYVADPEIPGDSVSCSLGYGGAAEAYALIVHERTDVHHPVGGAKYLEIPLKLGLPKLGEQLRVQLTSEMQKAGQR